ncbi:BTAD domain-containing putative transcriptional regulator [Streptomyces sp. MB22_4]|uniref:AfsR/SARP family transcriptional regulator n=1 Tax=Streptomyces sp. MB22_4 TaxID=3383120 RepID=UPI0039A344BD
MKGRRELRFGLLGPPVLYDHPSYGHPCGTRACEGRYDAPDTGTPGDGTAGDGDPDTAVRAIGSPKVRALLAALLLEPGRVVSVESLKDALWGGAPPVSARASLHNHVTRLRRLLDDPERLRSVPPGYLLRVDQGELDVHVFDALVADARAAHVRRDWPGVVRACTTALALWRGTPLSGLPELGGNTLVTRLVEARLLLLEWRYDAELALGGARLAALVPQLAALVAEHPLREAYHRQLMLALHRTGRQAEALAVHRDLRARLIEELGVEPGPAVREAHVEVLRGSGEWLPGQGDEYEDEDEGEDEGRDGREDGVSWGPAGECCPGKGRRARAGCSAAVPGEEPGPDASGVSLGNDREVERGVARGGERQTERGGAREAERQGGRADECEDGRGGHRGDGEGGCGDDHRGDGEGGCGDDHRGDGEGGCGGSRRGDGEGGCGGSRRGDGEGGYRGSRHSGPEGERGTGRRGDREGGCGDDCRGDVEGGRGGGRRGDVEGGCGGGRRGDGEGGYRGSRHSGPEGERGTGRRGDREGGHGDDRRGDGDGAGDAAPPHPPRVPQLPPPPAQLPPPPAHFTGRTLVQGALRHVLTGPSAPAPAVAVVSGMAGVGKSALALHVAHELRERFPDGQLYVNLHGATPGVPPLAPAQALAALLRDLGVAPRTVPEHPDAAAALLRSLLAPARVLLVLDDAADAAQVRPLLPAGPGCAVIVTSRSPLTTLDGTRRFPLAPLAEEDSAELLRLLSGRAGLDAGHALVHLTGGLPLALRVVAARLTARRALTPDALAGQLAATGGRLRHLEYDDLSVRRSLGVAHDALAAAARETDRDAALVLRGIGALDLPTYGAPLLADLTGIDARRAEAALDRLVDVALLEETAYGRYTPHDLVREFARELAEETGEFGAAAVQAPAADGPARARAKDDTPPDLVALRWYAAAAEHVLVAIVEPGLDLDDRRRPTPAQPAEHAAAVAGLRSFESAGQAGAWGESELENVVALVARNADATDPRGLAHLSVLARLLFPYVQRSGRVAEMEVLGRAALGAARRLGDPVAEAYALGDLAGLHFLTGRHNEALALTDRCLESWRRLGVPSRVRRCLNNRGLLLEGLGRFAESEEALRQSLTCSRLLNDPFGEAVTHSHLGNLYEHTDPRAAIEQHRRSLAIGEAIGAVLLRHSAHCNIGFAHLALGEPAAAARHFEESLRILGGQSDWHGESQTRLGLVRALRRLGESERAYIECGELLRRADARADRYTGGLARHQRGLLLLAQGRRAEAHDAWRAALAALTGTDEQAVVAELRELLAE